MDDDGSGGGLCVLTQAESNVTPYPPTRSARVRPVALQAQVSAALHMSAHEISDRMSWLAMRLMELRRAIQESLELLRALIRVSTRRKGNRGGGGGREGVLPLLLRFKGG